jgi:co-chaperonin GroES (HSP10)
MNIAMAHDVDPKEKLLDDLGDISGIELFNNQILVATYIRPEKTKGGIIMTDRARDEDRFQSKIGLVVGKGPSAFQEEEGGNWFNGRQVEEGEWIIFRPSDGWSLTVNGVSCRILSDTQVKGTVNDVDKVW